MPDTIPPAAFSGAHPDRRPGTSPRRCGPSPCRWVTGAQPCGLTLGPRFSGWASGPGSSDSLTRIES